MISEEQLQRYEDMATDYRYDGSVFKPVVIELIAEVRRYNLLQKQFDKYQKQLADTVENLVQTRREADWLAKYLAKTKIFHPADSAMDCPKLEGLAPEISCITCWREAARKATKEN